MDGVISGGKPERSYRPKEAAAMLGFAVRTLYRRIAKRELVAKRDGGCTVISESELFGYQRRIMQGR